MAGTIRGIRDAIKRTTTRLLRSAPVLTILVSGAALGPCAKLRGNAQPSSTPSSSSATITAASASAAAAASASAAAAAAASASAAASAAATAAATNRAKQQLADLQWMVTHNVTANPAKAGEGDAATKCDAVEAQRTALPAEPDPDLKNTLDEASALCAFDIPLVTASESLDHLSTSTSQASKLLMCTIASRETDRARAIKPRDPKIRRLDARRITACGR